MRNINHPLCGCTVFVIQKNHLSVIMRLFKPIYAEGYYVSTVGLNEATIKKYIQEQEKHDIAMDKLSVKEYEDPFKG